MTVQNCYGLEIRHDEITAHDLNICRHQSIIVSDSEQYISVSIINSFSINPQIIFSQIFKYHQTTHFQSIHKINISRNSYFTKLSTYIFRQSTNKNIQWNSSVTKNLIWPQSTKKIFEGIQVSPNNSFSANPQKITNEWTIYPTKFKFMYFPIKGILLFLEFCKDMQKWRIIALKCRHNDLCTLHTAIMLFIDTSHALPMLLVVVTFWGLSGSYCQIVGTYVRMSFSGC